MELIFEKVVMDNFMSYEHGEFNFNKHSGLNLICGKNNDIPGATNGSGKSTLIFSIVYALYGRVPQKLKNENITNRYRKGQMTSVSLTLKLNNDRYKIISGIKNKNSSFCELYQQEDGNWVNKSKSTIEKTREYIQKNLIPCPFEMFMHTILLNANPAFNFYNMKGEARKEFINNMFDLNEYYSMYDSWHKEKQNVLDRMNVSNTKLLTYRKNSDDYEQNIAEFETNKTNKINELKKILETHIAEYNTAKSNTVEKNTELIDKCNKKITEYSEFVDKYNTYIKNIRLKIRGNENKISANKSSIADRTKIITKHSSLVNKVCSDCKDVVSDHYNLKKYQSEIDSLTEINNKLEADNATYTENIKKATDKLNVANTKLTALNSKIVSLNTKYDLYQRALITKEKRIDAIRSEISTHEKSLNPYHKLNSDNTKRIEDEEQHLQELKIEYNYLQFLETMVDKKTITENIVKNFTEILNAGVKKYLKKFGSDYTIKFNPDMSVEFITDVDGSKPEYGNFSYGEQMRISIATSFAFRDFLSTRSNINPNIFMIDEYFDANIDRLAIDNIVDVLKDITTSRKQNIYIISQREELNQDIFNSVIEIVRTNHISEITYKK